MIRKASENLSMTSARLLAMPLSPNPGPVRNNLQSPTAIPRVSRIEEEIEINIETRKN